MTIKRISVATALVASLAACGSINLPKPAEDIGLSTTLNNVRSDRVAKDIAACITPKLQANYPSASLTMLADSLYAGKVPGTEPNQPVAVYEISAATGEFLGSVTLKQAEPIDTALVDLFKSCL
ncbi:MAG: hypothetical protein SOX43_08580 [Pelistega sp.]|nr:hypothetical protein [Pelistega sp.]